MNESTHEVGVFNRLLSQLISHPALYDMVQLAAGSRRVRNWLAPFLAETRSQTLLDVGAGTGTIQCWLPPDTTYIWIDNDPKKLRGYTSRPSHGYGVLTEASRLCFADKSIDYALCMAVSHHLSSEEVRSVFKEISRVVKRRLFFVDALDCPSRFFSRSLWKIDRGAYPRTESVLREYVGEYFEIERVETLDVFHRYMLYVAVPKPATATEAIS